MIRTLLLLTAATIIGCTDANIASSNLSKAADMFEIDRRVVFYNGITGEYMLQLEGKCSISHKSNQLSVTCKTGPGQYKKHFLGLSDNVTYFAEQVEGVGVSTYHNRIVWKPQTILPRIEVHGSLEEFTK